MVQSAVLDEFTARLQKRVAALKVGNGLEQGTDIGPLINAAAVKKVSLHMHYKDYYLYCYNC
jgi:succinate-semialdehyde dehydrogenase / glutarate-semialdehyde dehydrogenase